MAGGKETPRQKMIGMMYLVLTALLALNVSKSILDAFVAIEENIQISNENEFTRGDEKKANLKEVALDKTNPDLMKKATQLMQSVEAIDKITAERIKLIDDIKLKILEACGEDIKTIGPGHIIENMNKNNALKPIRMKLDHVEGKDKYDDPMRIMIGDDIKRPDPKGDGMKLWNSYNGFRKELTELIASSVVVTDPNQKKFFFKAPSINTFKDFSDLNKQIDKAIASSNVSMDDREAIKKIYGSLTKQEYSEVHDVKGVHWIGKTFDHSPSVAALASLSSMQNEILTARADAVSLIRLRVGGGEYSFNKIMALAYGPELVNANDDVVVEVLMAAYDSDKAPTVTLSGQNVEEVKDGKGFVRTKAGGSEMVLSGEITIKNKSGIPKTLPWTKTIKVMKPMGTVSLPEMNMLYRGYDNKVEAVASGYEQTKVTGSNVSLSKTGTGWIGKPGTGKECSITVSGFNSSTGKTVSLGTFKFRVSNLPPPQLKLGSLDPGASASAGAIRAMTTLFAKYPPEIPLNATFRVTSYEISVSGAPRPITGSGASLSADAQNIIRQARPGSMISITAKALGPDGGNRLISGTYKVQ